MAANARSAGHKPKPSRQGKTDIRQQKRKRETEDLQKLQNAVNDLVSGVCLLPLPSLF
jgi:ATP-dependent RNA helicase DDX10/DBP4